MRLAGVGPKLPVMGRAHDEVEGLLARAAAELRELGMSPAAIARVLGITAAAATRPAAGIGRPAGT
jgi:hypothetical protein